MCKKNDKYEVWSQVAQSLNNDKVTFKAALDSLESFGNLIESFKFAWFAYQRVSKIPQNTFHTRFLFTPDS